MALTLALGLTAAIGIAVAPPALAVPQWSALGAGLASPPPTILFDNSGNLLAANTTIKKWNPGTATWSDLSNQSFSNSLPDAMVVHGSDLYVGGSFTRVGALTANSVAKWNGTSWSALGGGLTGGLTPNINESAMVFDDAGHLFVAGTFNVATNPDASTVSVKNIAMWDTATSTWSALGYGLLGNVYTLAYADGKVYVGGDFTQAMPTSSTYVSAKRIAVWDIASSTWSTLGQGANNYIISLAIRGGTLYAGGGQSTVTQTDGTAVTVNYVSKWTFATSQWSAMGGGVNDSVFRVLPDASGNLYAGGYFTIARNGGTNVTVNGIARWDSASSTWAAMGTGMAGGTPTNVYSLQFDSLGDLYVSGFFTSVNGVSARNVAKWSETRYTVTYNGNGNTGGTAPTDSSSPYVDGSTVTTLGNTGSLTKTNYAFSGWNTAADGTGTSYAAAATFTIAANTTLYAQWTPTYTVTYDGNGNTGGTAPTDASSPYTSGSTVTALDNTGGLSNAGYTFAGWNTAADGTGTSYAAAATFTIAANTTLYAQWTRTGGGGSSTSATTPPPAVAGTLDPIEANGDRPLGEELTTVDGRRVPVVLQADGTSTGIEATGPGFALRLASHGTDGAPAPLGPQGTLRLLPDGTLQITGTGSRPGSAIRAYLMSTPILLTTLTADGDGTFQGSTTIPAGVPAGTHTLQANSFTPDGQVRSISLGVEVLAPSQTPTTLGTRVVFAYRSALLTSRARSSLRALVRQLPPGATPTSVVVGAVRARNATPADRLLAKRRAAKVAAYLKAAGLTGAVTVSVAPIRTANTPTDRRVTVTIRYSAPTTP